MAIDSEIRSLLTCALLHLDPRILDKRVALNSILIEVSLYNFGVPCSIDEIQDQIDIVVNQRGFLGEDDLNYALDDCIKRELIIKSEGKYILAEPRKAALQDAFSSAEMTLQQVKRGLTESIELETNELLSSDLQDKIFLTIRRVIAEEVYEFSLQIARENLTIDEMILRMELSSPINKIEDALKEFLPQNRALFRKKIIGGIVDYFRDLPAELQEMLRLIHLNILINQILGLDPSMVRLLRDWFSKRRLYLDTNVVLSYIFEGQTRHSIVIEIIQASINLQIQLLISPATLDECRLQVERAKKNYHLSQKFSLIEVFAQEGDDAILATFSQLKHQQTSLHWEAFIAPFESLEETLLEYNIIVEEACYEEAQNYEDLDQIRSVVEASKPPYASPHVIEHDTLNCALILLLRDKYPPDERGQIVWLLTIDRSLWHSQKRLISSKIIIEPYCMQAPEWGEIVLPLQSLLGFVFNDFIGYLAQAKLGALADPTVIQLDFLETIHNAEIDVDRLLKLHPEQVKAAISRLQMSRSARLTLTRAIQADDIDEKKSLQLKFSELFNTAIEDTDPVIFFNEEYIKKIDLLEKRVGQQDQTIAILSETLKEAESSLPYKISSWLRKLTRR